MSSLGAGNRQIRKVAFAAFAASALAGASGAGAAVHSLDDPENTGPATSDVEGSTSGRTPQLDPFGRWIVYLADSETDGLEELWSSPLAGGVPVKLSTGMQGGDFVSRFAVSADGTFVAFVSNVSGVNELYVVDIGGGTPVKKNHALGPGELVSGLAISADSLWLVYSATVDDGSTQLFRVELSGSNPAQFEYTIATKCTPTVFDFGLSPGGGDVAFTVAFTNCPGEPFTGRYLYRAAIEGTATDLVAGTGQNGYFPQYEFTHPLGGEDPLLVYIIDSDAPASTTYPAQLQWDDGSLPGPENVISGSIVSGGNVEEFRIVPFTNHVVFFADRELDGYSELYRTTAGVHELVQTPLQLHENFTTTLRPQLWGLTADGTRVAFVVDANPIGGVESETLRSASVSAPGGSSNLLESALDPSEFARVELAGSNVVFLADRDVPSRAELFAVPAAGGTVSRLNPTGSILLVDWDVHFPLAISPDHSTVHFIYTSELLMSGAMTTSVRSAPIPTGPSVQVGPTVDPATGKELEEVYAPLDGRWVVSLGDATTLNRRQLYVSDACLFCDSFEGTGDGRSRWD